MLEKSLIASIHNKLPKDLHHQSMTGASMSNNGILDHYYDGPESDMWIEYKQRDSMPRNGVLNVAPDPTRKYNPGHLTTLQLRWAKRRHMHGANAFVMVGLPDRTVVLLRFPSEWEHDVRLSHATIYTRDEAAQWITDFCNGTKEA